MISFCLDFYFRMNYFLFFSGLKKNVFFSNERNFKNFFFLKLISFYPKEHFLGSKGNFWK